MSDLADAARGSPGTGTRLAIRAIYSGRIGGVHHGAECLLIVLQMCLNQLAVGLVEALGNLCLFQQLLPCVPDCLRLASQPAADGIGSESGAGKRCCTLPSQSVELFGQLLFGFCNGWQGLDIGADQCFLLALQHGNELL